MAKDLKEYILNLDKIETISTYSINYAGDGILDNGLIVFAHIQEIVRLPNFSTVLYIINFASANFDIVGNLTIDCNPFENGMFIPNTEAGRVLFGAINEKD